MKTAFKYCKKCVMPNTKPDLFFDEEGEPKGLFRKRMMRVKRNLKRTSSQSIKEKIPAITIALSP